MPKNKGAGGKNRRKGKGTSDIPIELIYKGPDQMYGQVTKSLGNGFLEIMCFSDKGNVIKRAHIRGKMRRRVWMVVGDIILVNHRGFQEGTCDIVHKYTSHDVRILRSQKHLPAQINVNEEEEPNADDAFV